jgi:hypothetical protein
MTAEPRPAVHALPARAESIPETLAAQWEPQHQYVGALLCQRAGTAGPLLDLVPDTAITEPRTCWTYVMYARTLFGSPNNVTLGGRLRRWAASVANPRLQTLDSQRHLSAAERRRMICDVDRQVPDCGFDTFPLGRCVDGTKSRQGIWRE